MKMNNDLGFGRPTKPQTGGGFPQFQPPGVKDPGFFRPTKPQVGGPLPRPVGDPGPKLPVGPGMGNTKPVGPTGKPANPMLDALKRRLTGA